MNYDNTNRGAIWNNTKKRPDKEINGKMVSDPDYTGSLNVEGHDFYVDAWKPGPSDNPKAPVLRFRVKRKDSMAPADYEKSRPTTAPTQDKPVESDTGTSGGGFEDSDIPFAPINGKLP